MNSFVLLQQYPACLVHLIWMVLEMGVGGHTAAVLWDLFNPYNISDMTIAWKKLCFILSDKFDFHMIDHLLTAVHAFTSHILMSFSVDETLFLR